MSNLLRRPPVPQKGGASQARQNHPATSLPGDGDEDHDTYIRVFIKNGLKLQDELMINHEAIDAARNESVREFQLKRQHEQ
jgi:ribosomal protein L16/L10AE